MAPASDRWMSLNEEIDKVGNLAAADVSDGIEHSLLCAKRLIESVVHQHRSTPEQCSPVVVQRNDDLRPVTRKLMGQAEHAVYIAVSRAADTDVLCPLSDIGTSIKVRLLVAPQALGRDRTQDFLRLPNCEIRVSRTPLPSVVVGDCQIALVRSNPEIPDAQASVIRLPAVVQALAALFDASWKAGVMLPDYLRPVKRPSAAPVQQRVLEQLRAGDIDTQSAQKLGMSLRTYRRHVASIMQELGAKSRFEAGALAAEAGLLAAQEGD